MICRRMLGTLARIVPLPGALTALAASEPFALTSFGIGASTAVSHSLGGITSAIVEMYRIARSSPQRLDTLLYPNLITGDISCRFTCC